MAADAPQEAVATTEVEVPASGRLCAGCGSKGFAPSILGPDRCTFCDGTEGGNPPGLEDFFPHSAEPTFMFLAGTAGTGKTTLARARAEKGDAQLMATTGIAAVNLGGTTINSILRYYDTASLQTNFEFGRLNNILRNYAGSGFRRFIVDEVSMMDKDQLTLLVMAWDQINEWLEGQGKPPMGLTLVGDFAQLPPVKADFAFESPFWERFDGNTVTLTEPRRQADPEFVRALQAVRRGDKSATDYFQPLIMKVEDREFQGTTILAKNDEVDRYNMVRLVNLRTPEEKFTSTRGGDAAPEWKNIPETLVLKPGCLVMILSNSFDEDRNLIYANGDLGTYIGKVNDRAAKVKLLRNGEEVYVYKITRERTTATGNKGVKADRVVKEGSIDYMPLRVAYATTVHKSQGLSMDNVQIMMNSQFWMSSGMAYVALSRARTPKGLRIVCSVDQFRARIRVNPKLARWL